MNHYPSNEMTFNEMVLKSIRLHYLTLKHTIAIIILLVLLKAIMLIAAPLFSQKIAAILLITIIVFIVAYLISVALLSTNQSFLDQPQPIGSVFAAVFKQLTTIYSALILYFVGSVVVYYLVKFFLIAAERLVNQPSPLHMGLLFIGTCAVLVYFSMFSFVIPLCVLDKKSIIQAFHDSLLLTEKNKLSVIMLFVLAGIIIFIVNPGAIHEHLLNLYHLDLLFDLVALSVTIPIFINLFLLIINDSKQKLKLQLSE